MTILVTGGTGLTGLGLAKLLHASKYPFLIASRSGSAPEPFINRAVKFNFLDESTFENPFQVDSAIDRIYLVAPVLGDAFPVVKSFIDFAMSKGTKRFVLCGGTGFDKGTWSYGKIHQYLEDVGVEFTVLRPTFFIENLGTRFQQSIRDKNAIFSGAGDGRIPFVGAEDIAQAAYDAILDEKSTNTDVYILGPKLYTYDEVASLLSDALGKKIVHLRMSLEAVIVGMMSFGLPEEYVRNLAEFEQRISRGADEAKFTSNKAIKGKKELRDYIEVNVDLWKT